MKKFYTFILFWSLIFSGTIFGQNMVITGVMDGDLTGGLPKMIEIYVINDITDLSVYKIGMGVNGSAPADKYTFASGTATAG
ncbi:MAG: hypothetical protein QNK33_03465, partial [Bacteroidales bacterium]|nr:hypothetical protein [Bacteroidales bacterium]